MADGNVDENNYLTLKEARDAYGTATETASAIGRQLALAGVAIVWLFGGGSDISKIDLPNDLLCPAILFISALALDLAQQLYKAIAWATLARLNERKGIYTFDAPAWINWPTNTFFWTKSTALITGYVLLLVALLDRIE